MAVMAGNCRWACIPHGMITSAEMSSNVQSKVCLKIFVLFQILSQGSSFKPDPGIQDVTQQWQLPVNQVSDSAVRMYLHRAI